MRGDFTIASTKASWAMVVVSLAALYRVPTARRLLTFPLLQIKYYLISNGDHIQPLNPISFEKMASP